MQSQARSRQARLEMQLAFLTWQQACIRNAYGVSVCHRSQDPKIDSKSSTLRSFQLSTFLSLKLVVYKSTTQHVFFFSNEASRIPIPDVQVVET